MTLTPIFSKESAELPSFSRFADAVVKLAGDEKALRRVVDAVSNGDADSYHAALAELKLEPFCYLFCRWVCLIVYERICRTVCSLEPIPLTDPAADIRAAGKSRSALSRTRMRRRPYRLARVGEIRPGNHPARSTERFSYDCMWRAEAHGRKGKSGCGVYLPDLEQPRPPDLPPGLIKLRLVKKG